MRMKVCALLLCFFLALLTSGSEEAKRNYYDALNVEPTATQSQIKKAFRSLAHRFHPDKNKSQEAEESFRQITEAYRVLANEEDRKLYDRLGHDHVDLQEEPGPNFDDMFNFFEEEPYFMWSFSDDTFADHASFCGPDVTFVFSEEDEYGEDF